jgi:hypothetical protein
MALVGLIAPCFTRILLSELSIKTCTRYALLYLAFYVDVFGVTTVWISMLCHVTLLYPLMENILCFEAFKCIGVFAAQIYIFLNFFTNFLENFQ